MGPRRPASNARTHVIDFPGDYEHGRASRGAVLPPRRGRRAGAVPGRAALAQGSVMGPLVCVESRAARGCKARPRMAAKVYEGLICLACRQVHRVNRRTGKVLGADEKECSIGL